MILRRFSIAAMAAALLILCGVRPAEAAADRHHKSKPAAVPTPPRGYDYAHPEAQPPRETVDLGM